MADIITPIIAAIAGTAGLRRTCKFTINKSTFLYGDFINKIISFVIIAAAIYFVVVLPLNKLAERRAARLAAGQPATESRRRSPRTSSLLEQIRDLLPGAGTAAGAASAQTRRQTTL